MEKNNFRDRNGIGWTPAPMAAIKFRGLVLRVLNIVLWQGFFYVHKLPHFPFSKSKGPAIGTLLSRSAVIKASRP